MDASHDLHHLSGESAELQPILVFNSDEIKLEEILEVSALDLSFSFNCEIIYKKKNFLNIKVELNSEVKRDVNEILREINEKFKKSLSIFLELNKKIFLRKRNENFKEHKLNLSDEKIQEKLNDSNFSTKILLNVLKAAKISDWDFRKFLRFEESSEKFFIFAIYSQDDFCLRLLNLFDLKLSQEIRGEILSSAIKSKNIEIFLAVLNILDPQEVDEEKVEEIFHLKCGEKSQNPFLAAVEYRNLKVLDFLLNCFRDIKNLLSFSMFKEAVDLSVEKEFFEIFNALKNSNHLVDPQKIFTRGENILIQIKKLHENIRNGNLSEVKKFSKYFPKFRLCYGNEKVCALELAIDSRNFEIFAFLRANFFITDRKDELDEKIENLSITQKRKIRDENLKFAKKFPAAFLLSKCNFDALSPISSREVQEMLEELSKNKNFQHLLLIASEADLKIIFDFNNEFIKSMDPSAGERTWGLAYFGSGKLYIGKDRGTFDRYGTFIHELTHLVFYLIYENRCLPYCKGDTERQQAWNEIVRIESEKYEINPEETEEIIRWVFQCYDEGYEQEAELAVRVNHIMARYLDNPQKVEELKNLHPELFNFYENFIIPDIQVSNVYRVIKLNNDFELIEKIQESDLHLKLSMNLVVSLNANRLILSSNVPKLALNKILNELKSISPNKVHVKAKNIFLNVEQIQEKSTRSEFLDLIESSQIERIILDVCETENVRNAIKILDEVITKNSKSRIIIVCSEEDSKYFEKYSNFQKVLQSFNFDDLSDQAQKSILRKNIKFQGKYIKASIFFKEISSNILPLLCSKIVTSINSKEFEVLENFIPRIVQSKSDENFEEEKFLDLVQSMQIVLISDIAGSGKTTFLKRIREVFRDEFPQNWISFVSLRDFIDELSGDFQENFQDKIIKILNLNEIEREIFLQKFSKGEVKILFDGFDEISPKCKEETLKLFKKFQKANEGKNQIWITTRTHLEHDLEQELGIESFNIKTLSKENQINFLCSFWNFSNKDENFIRDCAVKTTQKIKEMIKNHSNLIGIPLIVKIVAEIYKTEINVYFLNKIKNLKISKIYQNLVENFLKIFNQRFSKNLSGNSLKRSSILQAHEFVVIRYFFSEKFANELGMMNIEGEWSLEEIIRCGILTCDAYKNVYFNHQTYGEFLLAVFMLNIIENVSNFLPAHVELFERILYAERFSVVRMFLREMLEDFEIKLIEFLLKSFDNSENYLKIFYNIKIFYDEKLFEGFLLKPTLGGFLIFDFFIKELGGTIQKEVFFNKNSKGETIFHFTVGNFEIFRKVLRTIKENASKKIQKELFQVKNGRGQNILQVSIKTNEHSFVIAFAFAKKIMTKGEIKKFLNEKDEDGDNFLHFAAEFAKSQEIFDFLMEKCFEIVGNPKEILMKKGKYDLNVLQISLLNKNDPKLFPFVFNLVESLCKSKREKKKLILEKNLQSENLLNLAAGLGSKLQLEFIFGQILLNFDDEKLKKLLRTDKGDRKRNLLCSAAFNKNLISIEFLWKLFEKKISRENFIEILYEQDEEENNFLHCAALFAKSKEIFEFLLLKVEKTFGDEEKFKNYLKVRSHQRRNLLQASIWETNENSFYIIFELFCKFFNFKDFIYETDENGENFFHFLSSFGSVSMLEFAFKKFEENLSVEEIQKFLRIKSEKYQINLLHYAAQNWKENSIKFLLEIIKKFLDDTDIKKMSKESDKDDDFPLHIAIRFNTSENFKVLAKLYEENFTRKEIIKILKRRDFRQTARLNLKNDKNMVNVVEEFVESLEYSILENYENFILKIKLN